MYKLIVILNFGCEVDVFYVEFIVVQVNLGDDEVVDWLVWLILILCNYIGDCEVF